MSWYFALIFFPSLCHEFLKHLFNTPSREKTKQQKKNRTMRIDNKLLRFEGILLGNILHRVQTTPAIQSPQSLNPHRSQPVAPLQGHPLIAAA